MFKFFSKKKKEKLINQDKQEKGKKRDSKTDLKAKDVYEVYNNV